MSQSTDLAGECISPLSPVLPLTAGDRRYWGGLYGSSKALAIHAAAKQAATPVIVLAPDLNTARRFYEELRFFRAGDADYPLLAFPDWETLPYDLFSPKPLV